MEYKFPGASLFFYGSRGTDFGMVHGIIRMKDKVDRDDLQRAVDTAMPRFPYFCTKAEIIDDHYCLVPNDKPFVVYEQEEPIPPGDPRVNGYLITFGCWEDMLYSDNFHGMGDGRGTTPVLQSVLYYYCLYHYGGPISSPGVMLADETPDPEEYANPFDYLPPVPQGFEPSSQMDFFRVPEERVGPDEPHKLYTISMKQDAFVKYTKSVDGSPAVMAALFLCRAIDEVHPDHDAPIVVGMPVDYRAAAGCTKTKQNCVHAMGMVYSDRVKQMPLEMQATCFRGMTILNSDPDMLLPIVAFHAQKDMEMEALGVSRAKPMIDVPPVASYMGKMDYGDIEKYRVGFCSTGDARSTGFTLNVFTAGDTITFNMQYGLKDNCYFKALLHQLLLAGVTLTIEPPMEYFPMKRTF